MSELQAHFLQHIYLKVQDPKIATKQFNHLQKYVFKTRQPTLMRNGMSI